MAGNSRSIASVLLWAGIVLVLLGLSASMGYTPGAFVTSALVIAVLMYGGAVWFGQTTSHGTAPSTLVVFDRERRIVSGGRAGELLTEQFPEILRPEIDRRSAAALRGASERFPCLRDGKLVVYEAMPVRGADGAIVYGILLSTEGEPAAVAARV